ncbi:MAG: ATP-binding cassette domain-containing protein, partial [Verrucomicrobiae bacterium]|nr:ATP-binding cassette domain-containing protein [Verrucomicrobiae bacterium]
MNEPPLLEAIEVSKHFGGLKAVDRVSVQVRRGEIVSIIGPNGAGKTTFFNCLTGIYPVTSGTIRFRDQPITDLRPHEVTRRGIARTFQNVRLFGEMSALENVMVGAFCRTRANVFHGLLGSGSSRREDQVAAREAMQLLELVGLAEHADTWARN